MSAKSKGRRNELKCVDYLEQRGWLVQRAQPRRFDNKDLFNLFDLVAVKGGKTRWVQSKTNRMPPPAYRKLISEFPGSGTKEIWIWYDRIKDPRIIVL